MTYEETLAQIFARGRFGMKPGLERITRLMERLGNPHEKVRAVQIAGTNGKGSTGAFLSSIMTAAGYRTAFFSSPHLSSFTERFRISESETAEETLFAVCQRVLTVAGDEPTFFEIVTAAAFLLFAEAGVDIAIMEAGMGGRFDASNVARPLVSVITPISLDHCAWLGDTVEQIAGEKAGIIKPGAPVVTAQQEPSALGVIAESAASTGVPLYRFGSDFSAQRTGAVLRFAGYGRDLVCRPALQGEFQTENLSVAIAAALLLEDSGFHVSDDAICRGAALARWPGRMELFPGEPPILLDGAHNPAGVAALIKSLPDMGFARLILVTGVMADKDWQAVVLPLAERACSIIAVTPAIDRALPAEEIAKFCQAAGLDAVPAGSMPDGLEMAKQKALAGDLILVAGSLFTVGEARSILTGTGFMPIRG